ncbi:hypothetical protein NQZ68_008546 [Dissostichus eleginoides]|nr:hypothetical protein NQZ68_008546 [Dissostichus eleginoides]
MATAVMKQCSRARREERREIECMASRCCCEHLRTHECVKRTQRAQQMLRGTRMRPVEVGKAVCPR